MMTPCGSKHVAEWIIILWNCVLMVHLFTSYLYSKAEQWRNREEWRLVSGRRRQLLQNRTDRFIFQHNGVYKFKRVDEDQHKVLVEWYYGGITQALAEHPVPLPVSPQQMSHGLTGDWIRASAERCGDKPPDPWHGLNTNINLNCV
jgi:hypothetical protein